MMRTTRGPACRLGVVAALLALLPTVAGVPATRGEEPPAPQPGSPPAPPSAPPSTQPPPAAPGDPGEPNHPVTPEAEPAPTVGTTPAAEHGATAAEALAFFMASRDYRTIRDLKSIMTESLRVTYDKDPTPFNGKKGIRLSAFDFKEPAPKPAATGATVSVTSLWDDQGEVVEQRSETVRLAREASGPWRVSAVQKVGLEPVRYKESVAGVTTLRQVLRAWVRRDFESAKAYMTDAFLKREAGRADGIEAAFAGDAGMRRAGFRILEMKPSGTGLVTARVRLVEAPPGRPTTLAGAPRTLELVKKGQRWLLQGWR